MKKKKLFTAGCSVSIRNECSTSFPEELSKLLDYELVNCAAGCGSNYRIWRMITKHIMDGNLTSDDLVVIQYTEPIRREFYSRFRHEIRDRNMVDLYDDGTLIRFKIDSHTWQRSKEETEFLKLYEENFLNESFEMENFHINNFNFQHMLYNNNINVIFIKTTRMNSHLDFFTFDRYKKSFFYDYSFEDKTNNQTDTDPCHFSDKGHKLIAQNLYEHILNLKLNE
jgi:hypothetical protein